MPCVECVAKAVLFGARNLKLVPSVRFYPLYVGSIFAPPPFAGAAPAQA